MAIPVLIESNPEDAIIAAAATTFAPLSYHSLYQHYHGYSFRPLVSMLMPRTAPYMLSIANARAPGRGAPLDAPRSEQWERVLHKAKYDTTEYGTSTKLKSFRRGLVVKPREALRTGVVANEMLSEAGAILSKKRRPRKPMRAVHSTVSSSKVEPPPTKRAGRKFGEDPINPRPQPRRRCPV